VEPEQIAGLAGSLNASDFTDRRCGNTWAAMQRLVAEGRPIDIAVLRAEGVDPGEPTRVLTSAHTAPVDEYGSLIRRAAYKRRVEQSLDSLGERVHHLDDPADITLAIQSTVSHILSDTADAGDLVTLASIASREDPTDGLAYGLPPLDAVLQPARPGNVIVIAARPSIGKTTIAQVIAESWSFEAPKPVLFVSLEMSEQELLTRALKRHERSELGKYNLSIYAQPRATTATVRAQAARLQLKHESLRGIVIDYLGLLRDPGEPENIRVARMSGEVKAMAREFKCPVLLLSQLNRQSENRSDARPRLSDLRDSGAVEQDADICIGLWRPNKSAPYIDLIGLKNRHGAADWTVRLDFEVDTTAVKGE
jgi:replicative DNA helicase